MITSFPRFVLFATIQYKPPKGRPEKAREELCSLISKAAQNQAKIIVCPEMATTGYIWKDKAEIQPFAEPAQGPTFQCLSPIALQYKIWIICGYVEQDEDSDQLYNSALVIGPSGDLVCSYRKILLYDADYSWATAGTTRYLIETEYGLMVVAICMDLNDYSFTRFLKNKNPAVFAFCTNWLDEDTPVLDYWKRCIYPWQGWFLAANSWGPDGEISFCGQSVILDPHGNTAMSAGKTGNILLYSHPDRI